MGIERTMLLGKKTQAEHERTRLRAEAKTHIVAMRSKLDIYNPNPASLPTEDICVSAARLNEIAAKLRELDQLIAEIESDLG